MNQQELDDLIGKSLAAAKKIVKQKDLIPKPLPDGTITISRTLPDNEVRLWHKDGKITSAETQKCTDNKYRKK